MHPLPGRSVVRALSLARVSTVSQALLLCERGNGSVLLPSLPPSRPPARTLGGGHWLNAVSSGHRPLRRVAARSALDSALVIDRGALARDHGTTTRRTQLRYREEATGTCAAIHTTKGPSIIVIRRASIIVIALTKALGRLSWSHIGRVSCDQSSPEVASADSESPDEEENPETPNPRQGEGYDASCQLVAPSGIESASVEAAGIEPASRDISVPASTCVVGCLGFVGGSPCRPGPPPPSPERNLTSGVPGSDPRRVGFGDGLSDLSDKTPQPGLPFSGSQCEVTFGK